MKTRGWASPTGGDGAEFFTAKDAKSAKGEKIFCSNLFSFLRDLGVPGGKFLSS